MEPAAPDPTKKPGAKRQVLLLLALALGALIAGIVYAVWTRPGSTPPPPTPQIVQTNTSTAPPRVQLTPVASGLPNPTGIVSTGQASDHRLFVLDRVGVIRIITGDHTVLPTPFLDISLQVLNSGEMGLLGLAFSPHYNTDGFFFVNYIDKQQNTVIARYHVSTDADRAQANSAQTVLRLKQPYVNHKGGQLAFGPDGYLYAGLGDGGSSGDPENRAQNLSVWFGKILRLDVAQLPYKIPGSNPFVGQTGKAGEIWDYGLRNPWRFSFDRQTHDLYIADVGQNQHEELDVEPASNKGGNNYGWRCFEGNAGYKPEGCGTSAGYVFPVLTYDHTDSRCSITGGFVYRGQKYPSLQGWYFYGDYCSGELFDTKKQSGAWPQHVALKTAYQISTFGEDSQGELYLADIGSGTIYALEAAP